MSTTAEQQQATTKQSLPALTGMVVGSMVGAGVFQLPARLASQTGVYGAMIAWAIAADVVFAAAKDADLPKYFSRLNSRDVPESAVLWTSILVTVILFAVQSVRNALDFAAISTAYTVFLMWAAGYVFLFLACILLAPATALYVVARRQQAGNAFTRPGLAIFIAVLVFAVIGVVLLATGIVQL